MVGDSVTMPDSSLVPFPFRYDLLSDDVFLKKQVGNLVYCHQEVLELAEGERKDVARRVSLIVTHLMAHGRTPVVKGCRGNDNRGWLRSQLGGSHGNQFYLWWAPSNALPVRKMKGDKGIYVRAIRHHDNHDPLSPGEISDYMPFDPDFIRKRYLPDPWTSRQIQFAHSQAPVRILKGYPGSGKTTSLFLAVNQRDGEKVLYLTWSSRLTDLADQYFVTFCPNNTAVFPYQFSTLLKKIVLPATDGQIGFNDFYRAIERIPPPKLGPWYLQKESLFAEIRAHIVGKALPTVPNQLVNPDRPCLKETIYLENRNSDLGSAARNVYDVIRAVENTKPIETFFPELVHAWNASRVLLVRGDYPEEMTLPDRIVVDEVQDLTQIEVLVPLLLARNASKRRKGGYLPFMLFAGDETQTVRPTDFEWGKFKNLVADFFGQKVEETRLEANLRCPPRIALLVNASKKLYRVIPKGDKPDGLAEVEIRQTTKDNVIHCVANSDNVFEDLIKELSDRQGLALVRLSEELPAYLSFDTYNGMLTPDQIKGLDFQFVCLLDPGKQLLKIQHMDDRVTADEPIVRLWKRTAVDRFRVALSRPGETLIFLDVDPSNEDLESSGKFLAPARPQLPGQKHEGPCNSEELLRYFREYEMDISDRIQQCIKESQEFVDIRPDLAWRRALQGVELLEQDLRSQGAVDQPLRNEAYLNKSEIALKVYPSSKEIQLESSVILDQGSAAAIHGGCADLGILFSALSRYEKSGFVTDLVPVLEAVTKIELQPRWLKLWFEGKKNLWRAAIEKGARNSDSSMSICAVLPQCYQSLGIGRTSVKLYANRLKKSVGEDFRRSGEYDLAIQIAKTCDRPEKEFILKCLIAAKRYGEAAVIYEKAKEYIEAIRLFRRAGNKEKVEYLQGKISGDSRKVGSKRIAISKGGETERKKPAKKQLASSTKIKKETKAGGKKNSCPNSVSPVLRPIVGKLIEKLGNRFVYNTRSDGSVSFWVGGKKVGAIFAKSGKVAFAIRPDFVNKLGVKTSGWVRENYSYLVYNLTAETIIVFVRNNS